MRAGSFGVFVPLVLLASVSVAGAQQPPPRPAPQPPPSTTVPPAPTSLTAPNPFAGFHPAGPDLYRSPDGSDRFQLGSLYPPPPAAIGPIYPGVYYPFGYPFVYPYGGMYETSIAEAYRMSMAETYLRRQRATARGGLLLQGALPSAAQVYIDGHYIGLAEEFGVNRGAIPLDAGAHRVELRAPGYDTLAFSVMVEPNSLVRYRGDMQQLTTKPAAPATPPAAPAASAAPKSFYVIPNCYAGDKPPSGASLPKGCDVKNVQTRK